MFKSVRVLRLKHGQELFSELNSYCKRKGISSAIIIGMIGSLEKLKLGAVDSLLLSEELDEKKIEEFEAQAKKVGTTIKIISTETREGVQLRDMGKVAAILRYEV